jgi:hypothetical protein
MIIQLICTLVSAAIAFIIYSVIFYDEMDYEYCRDELAYAHVIGTFLLTISWYVVPENILSLKYQNILFLLIAFLQFRNASWFISTAYYVNHLPFICMIMIRSLIGYVITIYFQLSFRYLVSCLVLEIVNYSLSKIHKYNWTNKTCLNKKPGKERVCENEIFKGMENYIPYFPYVKVYKAD